jgi:hypothetical protein
MLKRNNLLFKSLEFSPDYNPNSDFTRRLLATHLTKFEKQIPRDDDYLLSKTGQSDQFDEAQTPHLKDYTVKF